MADCPSHEYYFERLRKLSEFLPHEDWPNFSLEFANVRLKQLESIWENLQSLQGECCTDNDTREAKRIYLDCKTTLKRHISELETAKGQSPTPSDQSEMSVDFHDSEFEWLDEVGIFNGDFADWRVFRDRFIEKVHKDTKMQNAEKLNVLKMAVTDRATRVLGHWPTTNENYELAWNKLCSVYNNMYQIAHAHIRSLQTLPRLEPATFDAIFDLINKVTYAQRQLVAIGVPAYEWDLMIVYLVEERLDDRNRDAWIDYRELHQIVLPSWDDMADFLQRRAVLSPVETPSPSDSFPTDFTQLLDFDSSSSLFDQTVEQAARSEIEVIDEVDETHVPEKRQSAKRKVAVKKVKTSRPLPMIERKRRRRRKHIGTGELGLNVDDCIVCKSVKKIRFVNCKDCPARGHLSCVREFMDDVNHELDWKCPKCLRCAACNSNQIKGSLLKCTTCRWRYHSDCLDSAPAADSIDPKHFKCDDCMKLNELSEE